MPPPERWEDYCPMGTVIPGTKFIAFKVPLKEALLERVDEKDKFSPTILIEELEKQKQSLAAVIDLTFTRKYYSQQEFLGKSIGHKKVFTKGHEVPSDDVYREFTEAVESFKESDKLIGVHCTHGVNRTGYLICRYMIEKLNMEPQDAIDLFNTSRGHNMERENYIDDLKKRKSGEPTLDLSQDKTNSGSLRIKKPRWRKTKRDAQRLSPSSFETPSQTDLNLISSFPQNQGHLREYLHDNDGPTPYRNNYRGRMSHNSWHSHRGFRDEQQEPWHNHRGHMSHNSWQSGRGFRDVQKEPWHSYNGHNSRHSGRGFRDEQQEHWHNPGFRHNNQAYPQHQRSQRHIGGGHWQPGGYQNEANFEGGIRY